MKESKETRAPASAATEHGKVQDLRLDDALQNKSEVIEEESDATVGLERAGAAADSGAGRSRRVEKSVLPEPVTPAEGSADTDRRLQNVRITTFESELGPYEFAMLGSGEFVLFRNVWRDGARYVQGLLIERQSFIDDAILSAFRAATLSSVTDLVVGFGDDVILVARAESGTTYTAAASGMEGGPTPQEMTAYIHKYESGIAHLGLNPDQFRSRYATAIRVTPTTQRGH